MAPQVEHRQTQPPARRARQAPDVVLAVPRLTGRQENNMLQPKRRKYRKEQKGRNKGISHARHRCVVR
jgi:hypothetical protein